MIIVKKYNFITFEGIDGSGKTTIINKLKEYLESKNQKVFVTTETKSNNSDFIKKIREILMFNKDISSYTELLLFEALRRDHYEKVIKKKLDEGFIVICDRYIDSSIVYQGMKGLSKKKIKVLNNFATDKTIPKITFLLDIDVSESRKRIKNRDEEKTKFDEYDENFFIKTREEYFKLYKKNKKRIKIINSSKEPKLVFNEIKEEIKKWLL